MPNVPPLDDDGLVSEGLQGRGPAPRAQRKEKHRSARGRRVSWLTASAGFFSLLALLLMRDDPSFLVCSIIVGASAAAVDYAVEHAGITRRLWDYPGERMPVGNVPLVVPLLFFFCGIIATFVVFFMSQQQLVALDHPTAFAKIGPVQIALVILACYFIIQYARGRVRTLTFWALPLSLALYLSFPEPMLLAVSILPVYIDYYLEKRLVKGSSIRYEDYSEQTAINIALSYFPTTLLILEVAVALVIIL